MYAVYDLFPSTTTATTCGTLPRYILLGLRSVPTWRSIRGMERDGIENNNNEIGHVDTSRTGTSKWTLKKCPRAKVTSS